MIIIAGIIVNENILARRGKRVKRFSKRAEKVNDTSDNNRNCVCKREDG